MAQVRRPELPAGPLRVLCERLHDLHAAAGRPSMRELQRRTRSRERPRGINPTTIHDVFSAGRLARWEVVAAVVGQLGGDVAEFAELWQQAHDAPAAVLRPRPPARDVSHGRAAVAGLDPMPAQLPLDVHGFTGRTAELARLDAEFAASTDEATATVVLAVSGTAGVGKTALAVHWAHQIRDRFPDGQLYVNLRGFDRTGSPATPAEAIRGFLDAFEVPPARIPSGLRSQADLYRSLLVGKRVLVLLDNARDAEQVRPLLPGAPGCLVVVTSRDQLTGLVAGEGAHPLSLDLLSTAEAREFLLRRLGPDRVRAEPAEIEQIIDRCERLPLALTIVAARAVTQPAFPLAVLAAELAGTRLDALSGFDPGVRGVFSWSLRTLTPAAAGLFATFGVHPGPDISAAALASAAGMPPDRLGPLLAEVSRAHLVSAYSPQRYGCHDLLRAYAAELAADRDAAVLRLFDHYLHSAAAADRRLNPHRDRIDLPAPRPGVTPEQFADPGEALRWFGAEHAVLLATVQHAAAAGLDAQVWQLTWALITYVNRSGHWHDGMTIGCLAVEAAIRLGDCSAQAHSRRGLAVAYIGLGRHEEAKDQLGQTLILFAAVGDRVGEGHTHRSLARAAARQHRYRDALRHSQQAYRLYLAAGDLSGQATALNAVGWFQAHLGDYQRSLECCQRALLLHQELGDHDDEAATWDSLGLAHRQLGRFAEAVTCYHRALALFDEVGDQYQAADSFTNLGDTYQAAGDVEAARAAWHRAVEMLEAIGHPDADSVHARLASIDQLEGTG